MKRSIHKLRQKEKGGFKKTTRCQMPGRDVMGRGLVLARAKRKRRDGKQTKEKQEKEEEEERRRI